MFHHTLNPTASYAQIGLSTSVESASPHQLILLLFDGAAVALTTAKYAMEEQNIPAKGSAISKAIAIISDGLQASLDRDSGGELAGRLYALYEYMSARLLYANINNDIMVLDEVRNLLGEIHEAWRQIGMNTDGTSPPNL